MKKYRLKDEKFRKLAQEIAGFNKDGIKPFEEFVSQEGSGMRSRLEEFGVFDLWFEEEPKFKSGDYIVAVGAGQKDQVRKIVNCEVRGDMFFWNEYGKTTDCFAHTWELSKIRHATEVEIKEYNRPKLPTINGYRGKLKYNYIVYGCKSVHVQDFRRMYEACLCMDLEVDSITIEGHKIQMETLKEIHEKTY